MGFTTNPELAGQFLEFITAAADSAPEEPRAFLVWWSSFKKKLAARAFQLNRAARAAHNAKLDAANTVVADIYRRVEGGEAGALAGLVAARQASTEAVAAAAADDRTTQRQQWIHNGERPSPLITALLKVPQSARAITALRTASGGLASTPSNIARLTAKYWAGVSAMPTTAPDARQEVLQSLAGHPTLSQEAADLLGDLTITGAEVSRALRGARAGTSPGADGIPVELYRKYGAVFTPLLARLFTAAGTLNALPAGFHFGVITVLTKPGDPTQASNYRPITLLNTDYRLLAKALANRLAAHLPSIIAPTQTAFLPGRRIGENVLFLQLIPHLLARGGGGGEGSRTAYVAFCDFKKAYDTVDRAFLLQIMERLGVGEGLLRWTTLLLSNTRASALVNGHLSSPVSFQAGVRQGCPLAPFLYLFIGQALHCHLLARGFGIKIGTQLLLGAWFADDVEVLLKSLDEVPTFEEAMRVFKSASNQEMSEEKTVVLPIGADPGLEPPAMAGSLRVVRTAKALGVTFGRYTDKPVVDWPALVKQVEGCFTRLARMKLTAFGRGFGSAAYGVSQLLYQAEFTGLPPPSVTSWLHSKTAQLVDRGKAPSESGGFAGVAGHLLAGPPANGGFGALPWVQHILARHALCGQRLLSPVPATAPLPPWVLVAKALLLLATGNCGALSFLGWASCPRPPAVLGLPDPLLRMLDGLGALGRPDITAGPWCAGIPLFNNPFLAVEGDPPLETAFWDVRWSKVQTIGQLHAAIMAIACSPQQYRDDGVCLQTLGPEWLATTQQHAQHRLAALQGQLPAAWVAAVTAAAAAAPVADVSMETALGANVSWKLGDAAITLGSLTVKLATELHPAQSGWRTERATRFSAFAALATQGSGGPPVAAAAGAAEVLVLLGRLWRLKWDNHPREVFWRLSLDGLPTAARMGNRLDMGCACGFAIPDRRHCYWDCPIAKAVVHSLCSALSPGVGSPPPTLATPNIWLARPPTGIHAGVWDLVCLAAVAAMDSGRRAAVRSMLPPDPQPASAALTLRAGRGAAARFWDLLADFCGHGSVPARWAQQVPATHPFIFFTPALGRWQVRTPS